MNISNIHGAGDDIVSALPGGTDSENDGGALNNNNETGGENNKRAKAPDINLANFFNLTTGEVNVKSLKPEEIAKYIKNITFIISKLKELFYNSDTYSFKAPLEDSFDTKKDFCAFLDELIFFFNALKRKFFLQSKGINAVPLSIDPTESGFPHFTDLWNFQKDHESAAEQLKALPPADEIIKNALESMFRGEFPIREQLSYAKYNYFSYIKDGKSIISNFKIYNPELIGSKDGQKLYKIIFYGFDERYNIFHFYSMLLTQDSDAARPLAQTPEHSFLNEIRDYYKKDLFRLAHHLDDFDRSIHPKVILKYTVGPYYSPDTINNEAIDKLMKIESGNPFMFKFTASGVVSIKTIKESSVLKKFYNKLFGHANSREIFSDRFVYNYMIVPFKLKQYLREKDETGAPARIYGLLEGGELIE